MDETQVLLLVQKCIKNYFALLFFHKECFLSLKKCTAAHLGVKKHKFYLNCSGIGPI